MLNSPAATDECCGMCVWAVGVILVVAVGSIVISYLLCRLLDATFSYHATNDVDKLKRKQRRRVLRARTSDVDKALQMLRDSVRC